jgi:hypothetical protein
LNKSESKIIATTVCDLLITYGWCVLIPYESGIKIANMDNTYLVANNDRVILFYDLQDRNAFLSTPKS